MDFYIKIDLKESAFCFLLPAGKILSVFTACGYCCSVAKWCLTLSGPTDCSTPGPSVFCYLLEFVQTAHGDKPFHQLASLV